MIIDVYAVTSRRNKRPRAVTSFHCGLQIADSGRPLSGRSDKGGRQSLSQSWQFWWRLYPPGSWTRYTVTSPANIEASWGRGCYKPATRCYKPLQLAAFLKSATDKVTLIWLNLP